MRFSNLRRLVVVFFQAIFISTTLLSSECRAENSNLFRAYIGAMFNGVKFSDVPINPNVRFDFLLSFAIDYMTSTSPSSPNNGQFDVFWDSTSLSPSQVTSIKRNHPNVRVGVSLGGYSIDDGNTPVYFQPTTVDSWVSNAVTSLTKIIQQYGLDGIDIDYEQFQASPEVFAKCIGRLITELKKKRVVKFVSIAPFVEQDVQDHYLALWNSYGHLIDYVNFQFYGYENSTTVAQFVEYFEEQSNNYDGGNILASFISDGSGGLSPGKGFFEACRRLKERDLLYGIFVWSADDSQKFRFRYEMQAQALLAAPNAQVLISSQ